MSQFEKDTVAANKLFVEAVQLVNSAENAKRPDEQVVVKPPFYVPLPDRVSGTGGRMFKVRRT